MNQILKGKLSSGEEILWEGQPESIKLFEKPFQGRIVASWVLGAVILIFALWYFFLFGPANNHPMKHMAEVSVVCMLFSLFLLVSPFLEIRNMTENIRYCITNQRMIAYHAKKSSKFQYRYFEDFTEASVESLDTGTYNFCMGPRTKEAIGRSRNNLIPFDESYRMEPLVYSSVSDIDGLLRCLPSYIKVEGIPAASLNKAA